MLGRLRMADRRLETRKRARSEPVRGLAPQRDLCPLDMIRDRLREHPAVHATEASVEQIYAAFVALRTALHRRSEDGAEEDGDGRHVESDPEAEEADLGLDDGERGTGRDGPPPHRCQECHATRFVTDHRHGEQVCAACGVVAMVNLNIEREFVSPADVSRARLRAGAPRRTSWLAGVSRWMYLASLAPTRPDPKDRTSTYWHDLLHLNHWVNLGEDELRHADRILRRWTDGPYTREARVVSVMLCLSFGENALPSEAEVRRCIGDRQALSQLERLAPPEATFSCRRCDRTYHRARDARVCSCEPETRPVSQRLR